MINDIVRHTRLYPNEISIIVGNASYLQNKIKEIRELLDFQTVTINSSKLSILLNNEHEIIFIPGMEHNKIKQRLISGYIAGDGTTEEMMHELNKRFELWNKLKNNVYNC